MKEFQCFEELPGKVTDAVQRKGPVVVLLEIIVQRRSEAFKDQTIMFRGQSEAIVHDGIERQAPSSASIDVLHNVGLDEGAVVIALDVPHQLDGYPVRLLSGGGVGVTLLSVDAFHHTAKGAKSHILDDTIAIGHHGSRSTLEMTDGIVPIGRIIGR